MLDVKIIKQSFEQAKPIANEVVSYFYEYMFSNYPEVKPLFARVDLPSQKRALINSLVFIVDNLTETDRLVQYLRKMGARHVNYGVRDEHYGIVGASLLASFAHFFGDAWTKELQDQWTAAYDVISRTMIEGAAEMDLKEVARKQAKKLILTAFDDLKSDPKFLSEVQNMARKFIESAMDEEVSKSLTGKSSKKAA